MIFIVFTENLAPVHHIKKAIIDEVSSKEFVS